MPKIQIDQSQSEALNRLAERGPIRTCVGCGRAQNPNGMGRVAAQNGDEPKFERTAFGRGAWVCREVKCVEMAWKKRGFERVLKLKTRAPESLKAVLLVWCEGKS